MIECDDQEHLDFAGAQGRALYSFNLSSQKPVKLALRSERLCVVL